MRDISAVMHPLERDTRRSVVGARDGLLQGKTIGGHAEDSPAGCDQLSILDGRTRVEDMHIFKSVGLFDAANWQAGCDTRRGSRPMPARGSRRSQVSRASRA